MHVLLKTRGATELNIDVFENFVPKKIVKTVVLDYACLPTSESARQPINIAVSRYEVFPHRGSLEGHTDPVSRILHGKFVLKRTIINYSNS